MKPKTIIFLLTFFFSFFFLNSKSLAYVPIDCDGNAPYCNIPRDDECSCVGAANCHTGAVCAKADPSDTYGICWGGDDYSWLEGYTYYYWKTLNSSPPSSTRVSNCPLNCSELLGSGYVPWTECGTGGIFCDSYRTCEPGPPSAGSYYRFQLYRYNTTSPFETYSDHICCYKYPPSNFECLSESDCSSCEYCDNYGTGSICRPSASAVVNGTNGACGTAAGLSTCDAPASNLCAAGTLSWVDSTGSDGGFDWRCAGTSGSCGGTSGTTASCSSTHIADVNGGWSAYSACTSCLQTRTCTNPTPVCSGATCVGSATLACGLIDGACGLSNGGDFASAPVSGLCNSGTLAWVDNNGVDGTFNWNCAGVCSGLSPSCTATRNFPPTTPPTTTLKDDPGNVVPVQSVPGLGDVNHLCQTDFDGSRVIRVTITASDPDGASDITDIQLRWNGITFTRDSLVNGVANFSHTFATFENSSNVSNFEVNITDSVGNTTGWISTGRGFKVWDCLVPVSGILYDGSDVTSIYCPSPSVGFDNPVGDVNFTSLTFTNVSGNKIMNIIPPSNYSSNNDANKNLVWGNIYRFSFNNDIELDSSNLKMRFNGASACQTEINLTDNSVVDPYSANPSLTADFSAVVDQDPWWQTNNGDAVSNNTISNRVPVTCTTANCKISLAGLVSAKSIINPNRNLEDIQTLFYISPSAALANSNTNYSYFFNQYYVKNGIGTVLSGNKTIADITGSPTGIYFVDGNLDINANKIVPAGTFLMIIVKGNINVANTVTQVDGILVANNIYATGDNATPLTFNGSLYASNNVEFTRTYTDKADNNTKAAVIVNHNPQMIFKLPGSLAKVLTNWQWGN